MNALVKFLVFFIIFGMLVKTLSIEQIILLSWLSGIVTITTIGYTIIEFTQMRAMVYKSRKTHGKTLSTPHMRPGKKEETEKHETSTSWGEHYKDAKEYVEYNQALFFELKARTSKARLSTEDVAQIVSDFEAEWEHTVTTDQFAKDFPREGLSFGDVQKAINEYDKKFKLTPKGVIKAKRGLMFSQITQMMVEEDYPSFLVELCSVEFNTCVDLIKWFNTWKRKEKYKLGVNKYAIFRLHENLTGKDRIGMIQSDLQMHYPELEAPQSLLIAEWVVGGGNTQTIGGLWQYNEDNDTATYMKSTELHIFAVNGPRVVCQQHKHFSIDLDQSLLYTLMNHKDEYILHLQPRFNTLQDVPDDHEYRRCVNDEFAPFPYAFFEKFVDLGFDPNVFTIKCAKNKPLKTHFKFVSPDRQFVYYLPYHHKLVSMVGAYHSWILNVEYISLFNTCKNYYRHATFKNIALSIATTVKRKMKGFMLIMDDWVDIIIGKLKNKVMTEVYNSLHAKATFIGSKTVKLANKYRYQIAFMVLSFIITLIGYYLIKAAFKQAKPTLSQPHAKATRSQAAFLLIAELVDFLSIVSQYGKIAGYPEFIIPDQFIILAKMAISGAKVGGRVKGFFDTVQGDKDFTPEDEKRVKELLKNYEEKKKQLDKSSEPHGKLSIHAALGTQLFKLHVDPMDMLSPTMEYPVDLTPYDSSRQFWVGTVVGSKRICLFGQFKENAAKQMNFLYIEIKEDTDLTLINEEAFKAMYVRQKFEAMAKFEAINRTSQTPKQILSEDATDWSDDEILDVVVTALSQKTNLKKATLPWVQKLWRALFAVSCLVIIVSIIALIIQLVISLTQKVTTIPHGKVERTLEKHSLQDIEKVRDEVNHYIKEGRFNMAHDLIEARIDAILKKEEALFKSGRVDEMEFKHLCDGPMIRIHVNQKQAHDIVYSTDATGKELSVKRAIFDPVKMREALDHSIYNTILPGEQDLEDQFNIIENPNLQKVKNAKGLSRREAGAIIKANAMKQEAATNQYIDEREKAARDKAAAVAQHEQLAKASKERRESVLAQRYKDSQRAFLERTLGVDEAKKQIEKDTLKAVFKREFEAYTKSAEFKEKTTPPSLDDQRKTLDYFQKPLVPGTIPLPTETTKKNYSSEVANKMAKILEEAMQVAVKGGFQDVKKFVKPVDVRNLPRINRAEAIGKTIPRVMSDLGHENYRSIIAGADAYWEFVKPTDPNQLMQFKAFMDSFLMKASIAELPVNVKWDTNKKWAKLTGAEKHSLEYDSETEVHEYANYIAKDLQETFGIQKTATEIYEAMSKYADSFMDKIRESTMKIEPHSAPFVDFRRMMSMHVSGVTLVEDRGVIHKHPVNVSGLAYQIRSPNNHLNFITSYHLFAPFPFPPQGAKVSFAGTVNLRKYGYNKDGQPHAGGVVDYDVGNGIMQLTKIGEDNVYVTTPVMATAATNDPPLVSSDLKGPVDCYVIVKRDTQATRQRTGNVWVVITGKIFLNNDSYLRAFFQLEPGDSGAPVFTKDGKLIGNYFGITAGYSTVSRIDGTMVPDWPLESDVVQRHYKIAPLDISLVSDIETAHIKHMLDPDRVKIIGKIPRFNSNKQKLQDVHHDTIIRTLEKHGIANTSDYHISSSNKDKQKGLKDLAKWFKKQNYNPNPNVTMRADMVYREFVKSFKPYFTHCKLKTFDEFVDFIAKAENGNKAPGQSFKYTTKLECVNENLQLFKDIYDRVFIRCDLQYSDIPSVFKVSEKEELLTTEKFITKGKVRTFMVSDVITFMIVWCLFADFHLAYNEIPFNQKRSTVGHSEFYGGWNDIFQKIVEHKFVFEDDISGFDGAVTQDIVERASDPWLELLPYYLKYTFLIHDFFLHVYGWVVLVCMDGLVLLVKDGQRSGVFTTLLFNTLIMLYCSFYCWCWFVMFYSKDTINPKTGKKYDYFDILDDDLMCDNNHGDDKIWSHSIEEYTISIFEEAMATLNFETKAVVCESFADIHYLSKTPVPLVAAGHTPYFVFVPNYERLKKVLWTFKKTSTQNPLIIYLMKLSCIKPYLSWNKEFFFQFDAYQKDVTQQLTQELEPQLTTEETALIRSIPIWSLEECQRMFFPIKHGSGDQNFNTAFKELQNEMSTINKIANKIAEYHIRGNWEGPLRTNGRTNERQGDSVDPGAYPDDISHHLKREQTAIAVSEGDRCAAHHDGGHARNEGMEADVEFATCMHKAGNFHSLDGLSNHAVGLAFDTMNTFFPHKNRKAISLMKDAPVDIDVVELKEKILPIKTTMNNKNENKVPTTTVGSGKKRPTAPRFRGLGKKKQANTAKGAKKKAAEMRKKLERERAKIKSMKRLAAGKVRKGGRVKTKPHNDGFWHMVDRPVGGLPGYDFNTRIGTMELVQLVSQDRLFQPGEVFYVIPLSIQYQDLGDPWTDEDNAIPAQNLQIPQIIHDRAQNFLLCRWKDAQCVIDLTLPNFDDASGGKMFIAYIEDVTTLADMQYVGQELLDYLQSRQNGRNTCVYEEFPVNKPIRKAVRARLTQRIPGPSKGDWLYTDNRKSDSDVDMNAHCKGVFIIGCAQSFKIPARASNPAQGIQWNVGLGGKMQFSKQLLHLPEASCYLATHLNDITGATFGSVFNDTSHYPLQWDKSKEDIKQAFYRFNGTETIGGITPPLGSIGLDISQLVSRTQILTLAAYMEKKPAATTAFLQLYVDQNVFVHMPNTQITDQTVSNVAPAYWNVEAKGFPAKIYIEWHQVTPVSLGDLKDFVLQLTAHPNLFDFLNVYQKGAMTKQEKMQKGQMEDQMKQLQDQVQKLTSLAARFQGKEEAFETETPKAEVSRGPNYYKLAKYELKNFENGTWKLTDHTAMQEYFSTHEKTAKHFVDWLCQHHHFPLKFKDWPRDQQDKMDLLFEESE